MAISKRLRFEILRRDNHTCRYCGRSAPEVTMQVDHVTPKTLGGSDESTNLVAACRDCNYGKSSIPTNAELLADVESDAVRWTRAMRQVEQIRAADVQAQRETVAWFESRWSDWSYGPLKKPIPPPDDFAEVLKFVNAGLPQDEIAEMLDIAMRANHISPSATWKYFCGCCWRRIRENQDMAMALLKAEGDA